MNLNSYQNSAKKTDRVPSKDMDATGNNIIVPLLGLAGEAGELLSEYKKHLRDGNSHLLFKERLSEELGDLLWYVSNVATKFDLKLDDIAQFNLRKTSDRWGNQNTSEIIFDAAFLPTEQLPRQFEIELKEIKVKGKKVIRVRMDGKKIGADLTDNADDPDGYRFHDVFHLGYIAVLGWSPVMRKLMGKKRKSDPQIDEVQDGGRAGVIDEAISALVFDYAMKHKFLDGVVDLDYQLLRTIKGLTSLLEVKVRSMGEWQQAILLGYESWRQVVANNGGRIQVDMDAKSMTYLGNSKTKRKAILRSHLSK